MTTATQNAGIFRQGLRRTSWALFAPWAFQGSAANTMRFQEEGLVSRERVAVVDGDAPMGYALTDAGAALARHLKS